MPVPFLFEAFPAFLEDLATKRGLDHETVVDLSPHWEGSLDGLLETALDLGPDEL
jgi:hypothetical protein